MYSLNWMFFGTKKLLDNLHQLKRSRRKRQRDSSILLVDHWIHCWWSAKPPAPHERKQKPNLRNPIPRQQLVQILWRKLVGGFFFPSIFALLLYCSKLRWHVCFGAFFWCLSCSVKVVSTASSSSSSIGSSSSSGSSSLEIDCRSFTGWCAQASTPTALQQKKWT